MTIIFTHKGKRIKHEIEKFKIMSYSFYQKGFTFHVDADNTSIVIVDAENPNEIIHSKYF